MGTSLRTLKKDNKGLGGKGKLTKALIDRLQRSGDLDAIKKAVYAVFLHVSSSKADHCHIHCPTGLDSWCGYQRDIANGTKTFKHGAGLPLEIKEKIRSIVADQSDSPIKKNRVLVNNIGFEIFIYLDAINIPRKHSENHFIIS